MADYRTLTAFYDNRVDAEEAVTRLVDLGISRNSITLTEGDKTGATTYHEKGFWESLKDLFLPDEDREIYSEGLRRGGYLVTVIAIDPLFYDKALDIMDDEGTVDLDERTDAWRLEGWSGTDRSIVGTGGAGGYTDDQNKVTIPVVEETVRVGKRDITHGRTRVRTYVTETPGSETVTLRQENISVERRPVDRPVTDADLVAPNKVVEVEEHREEPVVERTARVVEEVDITKDVTETKETVDTTKRRTDVEVDTDADKTGVGTTNVNKPV